MNNIVIKKITLLCFIVLFIMLNSGLKANTIVNEAALQYVRLVLALGEHDEGYVDAYYGPQDLAEKAKSSKMSLKNIVIASKMIQDVIAEQTSNPENDWNELEELRLSYLKTQLSAVSSRALMLIGNVKYDFDQQSKALYDTLPPSKKLADFQPTLDKLNQLLPGDKPLIEKVTAFRQQFIIPKEKLSVVFDAAIKECRERTKKYIDLPENEDFTLEYVTDKPWSGYNWYKGKSFSLIQVNTELPIEISRAIDLGCHEGYPGHHTYNGLLEKNLYRALGWIEYSVYPLFSPQSLIAEGSANYGIEMAFPGNEKLQFEKKVLYPLAGISPKIANLYIQVNELTQQLTYAGNEVARQYLNQKIDAEKAQALLQKYALMNPEKAKQRVRFIDTYGAYVINYNWGKDLVKQWVESGSGKTQAERWKRFSQLLSSPRLPSTLN